MQQMMLSQTLNPAQLQSWRDQLSGTDTTRVITRLIDTFLTESWIHLAALDVALSSEDTEMCAFLAHRLLAGCGMLGALHMMELCREIEARSKAESPDLCELAQLLVDINKEYERVSQALQQQRP